MLGTFRGFLATWPARIFFAILAGSFAVWGIANKDPFGVNTSEGVTVGSHTIEMAAIQRAYRQGLAQALRSTGQSDASPELRQAVAGQTIERVATQAALQAKASDLRLATPDDAVRDAAFEIPAFHDKSGKFDHATMVNVLRDNGLTEAAFLDLMRDDVAQQQILGAIQAGIAAPDLLVRRVYAFQHETRTADIVELPFDKAPPPPAPTDAQLHRWHANHPAAYSTPEMRRIRAVVLTPETVGKDVAISDADLRAAWEQRKASFSKPARRSVQVLSGLPDLATAGRLASQWRAGGDWAGLKTAAQKAGGADAELADATKAEFPAPELAEAAFATDAGIVADPVKGAFGWYVVKVTKATPGETKTLEQATPDLRAALASERAVDLIYDRANRIEDLLSGGTKLSDLPGDLGVGAVEGTLDHAGNTADGAPAPIPGSADVRAAVIAAAFAGHVGDPAKLTQVTGQAKSYYAVEIESVAPPAPKPFEAVADQVRADWTRDQIRREQDRAAADLLTGVQKGGSLAALAAKAGLTMRSLPPTGRDEPAPGVPPPLVPPLFGLKKGEATMVETAGGFIVAVLTEVTQPDPAKDPAGFAQLKDVLSRSLGQDVTASFASAVREAAHPKINGRVMADLTQSGP